MKGITPAAVPAPAGPNLSRRKTHGFHAFVLAAALITVAALAGCGNGLLPETPPATGSASLSWSAPVTNDDGTQLTDLAGYKVYYGSTPGVYDHTDVVGTTDSYVVTGLTTGQTYYFTVTAYDASGSESEYATEVSKVIS
jgi:hypothetical protein